MATANDARRVALYLRVSTDGQTTENQRLELQRVADKAGWQVVEVYLDQGVSGTKGREQRPAFDRLCKDATRRRFDVIAAWSVDRLGRSLQHLVSFLEDVHRLGIDLYLHQQGIDTTTPAGKAMFQMLGVFAEFERAMIRERVNAGLARAKAGGKTLGRPKGGTRQGRRYPRSPERRREGRAQDCAGIGRGGERVVQRVQAERQAAG